MARPVTEWVNVTDDVTIIARESGEVWFHRPRGDKADADPFASPMTGPGTPGSTVRLLDGAINLAFLQIEKCLAQPEPTIPAYIVALVGAYHTSVDTARNLRRAGSRFSTPVMPVAVGIYLPLSLAVPIFAGGMLNFVLTRKAERFGQQAVERTTQRAVLISSGLIAGEAVAGILIAIPRTFPDLGGNLPVQVSGFDTSLLTVAAVAAVVWVMYRACRPASSDRP